YLADVRRRTLGLFDAVELESEDPLLGGGFVYDLIIQHEHQHNETILQTLQLTPGRYLERLPELPGGRRVESDTVVVPPGRYQVGSDAHEPYDNEHPRHAVQLEAFEIDRFPVSNGDFLRFMEDGGYQREELWSPDGWEWRCPGGDAPATAELANLDQRLLSAAPVGAYPRGASALGCEQMLGDVWEWTSSDFLPYPEFVAFPYSEYSEPFWGHEFKVLRGGSWATRPRVARNTFRNWDSRLKRQIFSGFRCA